MGVHGLWKLIEPAGKPVPLETLENKVLAVDISIWLHQAVKGFQDSRGAPVPNAHLLGVYHRLCKLLYFKIKPIFVFDGGVPVLKKETIAKRNQLKSRNTSEADRLQKQLLSTLLQHTAISKVLSEKTKASITAHTKKATKHDQLYVLPTPEAMDSTLSSSSEEEEEEEMEKSMSDSPTKQWDIHTIDTKSEQFKALPLETRHEILTELKETRKQSSWGRLHELPKQSDDFATYQMKRLLNRQAVQAALDEAAQEMGGSSLSLVQLESLLKDQGIPTVMNETVGKRIVSDPNKRYLYIKDVKEAMEKAKQNEEKQKEEVQKEETQKEHKIKTKADLEEEEELQRAIALSLQEVPSTSDSYNEFEISLAEVEESSDEDFEEVPVKKTLSSAQSYMMEYTGLTPYEIEKILGEKGKRSIGNKDLMKGVQSTRRKSAISQHVETTTKPEGKNKLVIIEEISDEENEKTRELPGKIRENIEVSKGKEEIENFKENEEVGIQDAITTNRKFVYEKEIGSIEEKQNVSGEQISEMDKDETESTEIMSEGDSTSSEEFIHINSSQLDTKKKEFLTLVINPTEDVDDFFSDIFEDKKDVEKLEGILKAAREKGKLEANRIEDSEFSKETKINDEVETEEKKDFENLEIVLKTASKQEKIEVNLAKKTEIKIKEKKTKEMEKNIKKQGEISEEKSGFDLIEKQQGEIIRNEAKEKDEIRDNAVEEVKSDKLERPELSIEEMEMMQNNLLQDRIDLLIEKSTKERMATNITDQMYQEAQELLELFGVPYVIAPMEAEAQCAFLDEIELTDGTITDDSDIWLFGGRTVYKNFFNPTKYVLEYKAENIKHHFKLSREQMILLALLVGSDYTIGIQGVGPVTALEILAAFPPSESNDFYLTHNQLVSGLREFKSWFYKGQSGGLGRSVLKSKLRNINFSDNFPSLQVVKAYLEPKVNPSREKFSWGKPDIINLSLFAKEKFGWSSKKIDEILNPVIKRIEEKQIQRSIKDFFKTKFSIPSGNVEVKSKRAKTAIERMGKTPEELIAEEMQTLEKEKKKTAKSKSGKSEKKKTQKKDTKTEIENSNDDTKKGVQDDGKNESQKPKTRTRRTKNEDVDDACKDNTEGSKNKSTINENINNDIENTQIHEDGSRKKRSRKSTNDDSKDSIKKATRKKPTTKASENSQSESEYFQCTEPKQSRRRSSEETSGETKPKARKKPESITKKIEETTTEKLSAAEELRLYENVAIELKIRRQRKLELTKVKLEEQKLQKQIIEQSKSQQDAIPESLQQDEEVQLLLATTSNSTQRDEEIKQQVQKQMEREKNKQIISKLHQKDIIHQKLRNQSSVLRNKLKAIEVFRKSRKGPGYVQKRTKMRQAPKEDAELSEDSGNE